MNNMDEYRVIENLSRKKRIFSGYRQCPMNRMVHSQQYECNRISDRLGKETKNVETGQKRGVGDILLTYSLRLVMRKKAKMNENILFQQMEIFILFDGGEMINISSPGLFSKVYV